MRILPGLALSLVLAAAALPVTAQVVGTMKCDANGCTRFDGVGDAAIAPAAPDAFVVNRAENPNFDVDLRTWPFRSVPSGIGTANWDPSDAGGSSGSGSVRLTNNYSAPSSFGDSYLLQCIGGLVPGQTYEATTRAFVPPGQPNVAYVSVAVHFFSGGNCTGVNTGGGQVLSVGPGGTGGWVLLSTSQTLPANFTFRSASVSVWLSKDGGQGNATLQALFDNVTFSGAAPFVKGDMNLDGQTDLLFRLNTTGQNDVWLMNGTSAPGAPVTISPAAASLDWIVAGVDDFNADHRNDLVFWNSVTGAVEFWLMDGTTRVGRPRAARRRARRRPGSPRPPATSTTTASPTSSTATSRPRRSRSGP